MAKMHVLLLVLSLLGAFLDRAAADDAKCARLGDECSDVSPCCEKAHDCFAGRCELAIYIPSHGETCNEKCELSCSTRGESCVEGVCRGPTEDCSEAGEECSVEKGCCDPRHDCVPLEETRLPPVWEQAGVCVASAAADTGGKCDEDTPCRFRFDLCLDGVCTVDPASLLEVSLLTRVKFKASSFDRRPKVEGGCGVHLGCAAMRTRDGKLEPTSRWSCSEKLGHGKCALMYTFASPQDVHTLRMAFHEGDKAKREIKVTADGEYVGTFKSSGATLDFESWVIDVKGVSLIVIEAFQLRQEFWIHVTEVEFLTRNQLGCHRTWETGET